jgi:hypothetical protein
MKVLIGECTGRLSAKAQELGWGRMWIARGRNIYTYPNEPWGLDNGAFRDWKLGTPFNDRQFWRAIEKAIAQATPPILAVIPDAPGDSLNTLKMSEKWLKELPRDLPWYLALQDGMTEADLLHFSSDLAGVFLGGTNKFKAEALRWRMWAKMNGLKFHYGRCGTIRKLSHAQSIQADSIDSAFPMWTMQRWATFTDAVVNGVPQSDLFMGGICEASISGTEPT